MDLSSLYGKSQILLLKFIEFPISNYRPINTPHQFNSALLKV